MNTLNQAIENALKFANSQTNSRIDFLAPKYGILDYWKNKDTFEWDDLCEFASTKFLNHQSLKFSLCMLVYFLENNLYQSEHKDKLMRELPYLKMCISHFKSVHALIFQANYDEIHFVERPVEKGGSGVLPMSLFNCNNFLGSLYIKYIGETSVSSHHTGSMLDYDFMRSIEGIEVNSLDDIDSTLFWHQVSFFKEFYNQDEKSKDNALSNLCKFYRWLLNKFDEHTFFSNSTNLTYELIYNSALIKHIKSNAYFTTLTSNEDLGDKPRIIFIVKNLQDKSTRMVKNSHFALYTDVLETSFYRSIIIKYFQSTTAPSLLTWTGQACYITDALRLIEQLKVQQDYPNPKSNKLNTNEAMMIREYFKKSKPELNLSTLNNKIGAIRRFFQWAKQCKYLMFDATFFDYLSQYEEPNQYRGNAISDQDLEKINEAFIELCNEDSTYKPYYAIFLILIETEFRVSQVCNLTVSALQPTLKNDQYLLYSNTKTSNGRKITQPICSSTKKILNSVIEESDELRNEVLLESYKDHIFLYRSNYAENSIKGINSGKFHDVFKKVCEKAGTNPYNSRNLRDTHMTKAFEYIMRHGKSDLEMGVLSRHTRIDTTKSHYIEVELTKMLESTYQITLGNRDINQQSHILDTLPNELNGNDTLVEGGCGHCMAKTCKMTGSLPCLICKDFVTTVDRKPYFINMIGYIDLQLERATIRHEIEDLTLIKTLYINWLREIYLKEEENNASTNCN